MLIPGITIELICEAFEAAYDREELEIMLRKRMSEKISNMTGTNTTLPKTVLDIVWA
jgi:hypothetical protein